MAWNAPITWVAGAVPTAALLNAQIRDNLLQTMPAKATTVGSIFVGAGVNSIAERFVDMTRIESLEDTTSTSYTNLATTGPSVTLTTGTTAFVFTSCAMYNSNSDAETRMSFALSGATTRAALDSTALFQGGAGTFQQASGGMMDLLTTLTPGSNTFTAKYRVSAGTGSFRYRVLGVIPVS